MSIIISRFGSHIGAFFHNDSYWAVKMRDGRWMSEVDLYPSWLHPHTKRSGHPYYDWSLDLTGSGDVLNIEELWLFCPKNWLHPLGSTASIKVKEPGTVFMFKTRSASLIGGKGPQTQVIGEVIDKLSGESDCFIWDGNYKVMIAHWRTSVYDFRTWDTYLCEQLGIDYRQTIPPTLGALSHQAVGLRL